MHEAAPSSFFVPEGIVIKDEAGLLFHTGALLGYRLTTSSKAACPEAALESFSPRNISRRSLLPRTMTTSVITVNADPATIKFTVQK
jgi:hypothetical protein